MEKIDKENIEREEEEIENFNKIKMAILSANSDQQHIYSLLLNHGAKIAHVKTAPETKVALKLVENNMTKIEIEMQKLKGNQELHGEILKRIETKIDKQDDHFGKHMEDHEKLEDKFAAKQTENDLKLLMDSLRQQQFEWLKYVVAVLVSVLVTVVVYNKFHL